MAKLGSVKYYKKKADDLTSAIVKLQGKCEWCGSTTGQLQCAHIIGRVNHTLRFDPMNVLCLCANCHRKAHTYPMEFSNWVLNKYPNRASYLAHNKGQLTKRTAKDYKELVEVLQKEYDRQS